MLHRLAISLVVTATSLVVTATVVAALTSRSIAADASAARRGVIEFQCGDSERSLPERFQLAPHQFEFAEVPVSSVARNMRLSKVTFPSPVETPHENNNTVHCEYFCPLGENNSELGGEARVPGVIVLHILGGDFDLSRLFCRTLASRGVAALFLKMPYYGERRQPGSPARMVSVDPEETVRGMTQAVLDVRQAVAWLGAQENVDEAQLGIMGISLGGITSALASGVEPRFHKVCLILAGGDMGEVAWTSEELAPLRENWVASGGTKEQLFALFRPVDPITYAKPVPGRKILMLNASHDEVVPPACTQALWRAYGEPPIVWWNAGHYSAARYLFDGMAEAARFFQPDDSDATQSTAK
jgi:dienelactone hydrolase